MEPQVPQRAVFQLPLPFTATTVYLRVRSCQSCRNKGRGSPLAVALNVMDEQHKRVYSARQAAFQYAYHSKLLATFANHRLSRWLRWDNLI